MATENENKNTVLQDCFSLFCSEETFRPVFENPFVLGDKTYATDSYTLIRCDSSKIDFEFENKYEPPNAESVIPKINTSEIINIDNIDWVSLMSADETISEENEVECGHCYGEGTYGDDFYYKGKRYDFEYECPVCDGSGYEEEEKQIPTGKKIFPIDSVVRFKDLYFNASYFYRLKKVKDLLNQNIELISYSTNQNGIMFRIGILEILLMQIGAGVEDNIIASID
jgi:hypothetical protein